MTTSTDLVHRFLFDDTQIRGEIVTLEHSYHQATEHQMLPSEGKKMLGRFLAATVLMAETLKIEGTVSLQVRGDAGPVRFAFAEANSNGQLRCMLKMHDNIAAQDSFFTQDIPSVFQGGVLTITIDPNEGDRYQGIVPLEGDTLAACLEAYFVRSEQLQTRFYLFADSNRVSGLMLQALPLEIEDNKENAAKREAFNEAWNTALALSDTLTQEELLSDTHEVLLNKLYNELPCRLFPGRNLVFGCSCNETRCANALASLGKDEVNALLQESSPIVIDCEFCAAHYEFDENKLAPLFN